MDYEIPKSFRNQPIKIPVGSKQVEITIEDLSFGKHKELMTLISSVWAKSKAAPKTSEMFDVMVTGIVKSGKTAVDAISAIQKQLEGVFSSASGDDRVQLLSLMTNNQINEAVIEDMQATEVFNILVWLLERNLRAEKNFEASLNSILSRTQANE